jgi:hypothetical protein
MSSDTDIARAMLKHLNTWTAKPCDIRLDMLERTATAMKLQPLSGTVVTKRYINGTCIGDWPFAVYVRIQKADTATRANAIKWLYDLGQWLSAQANPDIGLTRTAQKIEITSLPSIATINEDGSEEYQAVYTMEYKQTK